MQRSILVLGGSGFVGQEVCLEGLRRGWSVTSLSRSGTPSQALTPQLLSQVTWHKGSALDPASYAQLPQGKSVLEGIDYLVHCVGILVPDAQRTYHSVSVETLQVALGQPHPALKGVGYVSAANFGSAFRSVLPNYYASKSQAEELLIEAQAHGHLEKVVIARPGLMWGEGRWLTKPIGLFYNIGTFFAAGLFPRALPAALVAKSLLDNLDDSAAKGVRILEVSDISKRNK